MDLRTAEDSVDGLAVIEALQSAVAVPSQRGERAATGWTVTDAVSALDPSRHEVTLFAALRLLQAVQKDRERLGYSHTAEEDPVRIEQELHLDFPPIEVTGIGPARGLATSHRATVRQTAVGLLGPNGALPYAWTEHAHELANSPYRSERDSSLVAFINLLQRRQLAFLYRAWQDAQAITGADRPDDPHPVGDRLRALAGLALADCTRRDAVSPDFKVAFGSVLSRRVRSPQALAAMLAHYFGAPVRVEEFVARWVEIPQPQRTRLGVQFAALGQDAVAGARVWDCSTCFRIYIGPLTLQRYRSFLPQGAGYVELRDLVALYVGVEYEWELVPVLRNEDVPYSWLGNQGLLLGWSSWLGVRYEEVDAADLRLPMAARLGSGRAASRTERS